jgi:hypothetical protein
VRFRNLILVAGLILIINISCRERGGKYISEGEIHYNIDYKATASTISKDLMPKNLVVKFKNNKILFEILSPIGNSGITNLVNPEKGLYDTYINFLGTRFLYAGKPGEMHPGFESMDGLVLKKTDKKMVICGYNCKSAEVTLPGDNTKVYEIWYTDEIKVKNSNSATPFQQIDGILMSFFFIMGKSEMRFEAEAVYKTEIPDRSFERRPKFRLVDRALMDKTITDLVNL